jgi:hypothetical protein
VITATVAKTVLGALGRRIPLRWVIYLSVAAPACLLAARFIDEVFTFARWAQWSAVALAVLVVVWESACIYYTGKFDKIGDGVKPPAK